MKLQYSIVAGVSVLALAAALPQYAEDTPTCPSAPCEDYIDILEWCTDEEYEVYDLDWEYEDYLAIECVCGTEALGKERDWSGWNATSVCYNCGDYEEDTDEYYLNYNWLVTCKTYAWIDEKAAKECWNSNLEEGCWEPSPYRKKAKKV